MMNPWYKDGLSFKCTGCGQCCTGSPGYVFVDDAEMQAMADTLNIPLDEFTKRYVRRVGNQFSLKERPVSYDCVFLEGKRCTVYHARPKQCRTFPWWQDNLSTPQEWQEAAKRCEGINHADAPLISLEEIQRNLQE
jgi:Fe-S-cluster containining protein